MSVVGYQNRTLIISITSECQICNESLNWFESGILDFNSKVQPFQKLTRNTKLFLTFFENLQCNNSKSNTFQALTGVEDAYFVAFQNWFGVADGVGQWSLEGNPFMISW